MRQESRAPQRRKTCRRSRLRRLKQGLPDVVSRSELFLQLTQQGFEAGRSAWLQRHSVHSLLRNGNRFWSYNFDNSSLPRWCRKHLTFEIFLDDSPRKLGTKLRVSKDRATKRHKKTQETFVLFVAYLTGAAMYQTLSNGSFIHAFRSP